MDLKLKDKLYVVTGATSGFGKAITEKLIAENAKVIINARGEEKLIAFKKEHPQQMEILKGDITSDAAISAMINLIGDRDLSGLVINAGGPPTMSFLETDLTDWDQAYKSILRWKVNLAQQVIPLFQANKYGRMVFIESCSVKQPVKNLVLSNSLRLAVVGFVKTLSHEVADSGIAMNILAPGYHATPAMDRLFQKKSEVQGITKAAAKEAFEREIPVGQMGKAEDLASLAVWLLSEDSRYITGQTISVDGGLIKGVFS